MAKVVATERGYYGRIRREPGDVFEAEGKASWFKPVDAAVSPEPEAPEPEKPKAKGGRKKAETIDAPTAEPFADAPEPVRVENEVNAATGETHPDWVAG